MPAYFIHPCNTASAMRHIVGKKAIDPETYLLIWLGVVGQCVGLSMPRELFIGCGRAPAHSPGPG
jgi:ubiquitin-like-conjugating enzyme ATG10